MRPFQSKSFILTMSAILPTETINGEHELVNKEMDEQSCEDELFDFRPFQQCSETAVGVDGESRRFKAFLWLCGLQSRKFCIVRICEEGFVSQ